ncbi:MAG: DUF3372 domain-containing protein, partial [Anaerolineales bacterium]|nr:DUF3372 domain-containing protein [Anaerolineales bacterium]
CCQNTATEHNMMEKLMVDSLVTWAKYYKVDSFRFDLMGHHMKSNMLNVRAALDALTLENDGVDGSAIYLYGEGWNFGEVVNNTRGENATQLNMAGTGIGTFSDRLRDAVRGPGPFNSGDSLQQQGFVNGLYYDPNPWQASVSTEAEQKDRLLLLADQIRVGLAGNLADYEFVDRNGNLVTGDQVDYNGSPAGYTEDPQEVVTYVSKHDNQTLYDINAYAIPTTTLMTDRIRIQHLGLSIVSLGQGIHFFHAGSDMLRSKSLDRDSYDSGDWYNVLDFSYEETGWGRGLPRQDTNGSNWYLMEPRLADANLMPESADIVYSKELFKEWMQIRTSTPLFSLETKQDVMERMAFHNTGPDQVPGVIVMSLSDMVDGADLDPRHESVVVVFNATDEAQSLTITETVGMGYVLHPVQQASLDTVVQGATFDTASGTFDVPARTTAVFIVQEPYAELVVTESGTMVENGVSAIDFMSTTVGTQVVKTFTVSNTGTSVLNLSDLTVTGDGFSLVDFGNTAVAPGTATTFQIVLDADMASSYDATVSFVHNGDITTTPFTFDVMGEVVTEPVTEYKTFLPLVFKNN